MPATLLLLIAIGSHPATARFLVDTPRSDKVVAADGSLSHASGFLTETGMSDPADAARSFFSRYRDDFGLAGQSLALQSAPVAGQAGAVRFSRTIAGLPVFGSDLVAGVDERGRVFVVNGGRA